MNKPARPINAYGDSTTEPPFNTADPLEPPSGNVATLVPAGGGGGAVGI